jgi:signal transduction histidine kinase
MPFEFDHLYALLLGISALASAVVAVFAWQRRKARGAFPLMLIMLSLFIWSGTYAIHWLTRDPQTRLFWLDATYIGVVSVSAAFFVFGLDYTGRDRWLNIRTYLLLAVEPVLTLILLWTDGYHGLFFAGRRTPGASDILEGGPWFWINVVYSYGMLLVTLAMLVQMAIQSRRPYRIQAILIVFGGLLPWIGNILSLAGIKLPGLDTTPIAFTATGIVFAFALLGTRLFDLVPVARSVLIERMNDGLLVLDMQDRVVDANPAALRMLDKTGDQVIGQPVSTVFDTRTFLVEQFAGKYDLRTEVITSQDPLRCYDVQIAPLLSKQGRLTGRLVTWYDISERKLAEMEREQLIAELDTYAHTVAHELKSPLALVIGFIDLLADAGGDGLEEPLRVYVSQIEQSSRKMLAIVDELLLFSRVRRQTDIPAEEIDMLALVQGALDRLQHLIIERQPRIILPESWPPVRGYGPWVEEVWANYLSNALKYGGTPPVIELGAGPVENGVVRFWVRDNGAGVPEEEQRWLFQPTDQFDRQHGGHGLGLSIVRRIVEKLGGTVSVESRAGEGSTFYFTLPTAQPQAEGAE